MLNAYILYSKKEGKKTHNEFLPSVLTALVDDGQYSIPLPQVVAQTPRLCSQHLPGPVPRTLTKAKPQKRYLFCWTHAPPIRQDVRTCCVTCPGKPGLWTNDTCFPKYNSMQKTTDGELSILNHLMSIGISSYLL